MARKAAMPAQPDGGAFAYFAQDDEAKALGLFQILREDGSAEPGDVAIGISHSGTTIDTVQALTEAGRQGARTVAITNFPRSPIGFADHVLTTAARESTFRSGATASRLAQLTVVDCLFVGLAQIRYTDSKSALETTYEAVRGLRLHDDRRRRRPEATKNDTDGKHD